LHHAVASTSCKVTAENNTRHRANQ
jgi:hypothetical protein